MTRTKSDGFFRDVGSCRQLVRCPLAVSVTSRPPNNRVGPSSERYYVLTSYLS